MGRRTSRAQTLTGGVGIARFLGLVPDGHAVLLQLEIALLLPGA